MEGIVLGASAKDDDAVRLQRATAVYKSRVRRPTNLTFSHNDMHAQ